MVYNWNETLVINDVFNQLFNNNFLSDIQFQFKNGTILYAHTIVLCGRSQKMYDDMNSRTNTKNNIVLIENYSYETVKYFLKFLYTDACDINAGNVIELIEMAKEYLVESLEKQCQDIIQLHFHPFQLLQLSVKHNLIELKKSSITQISADIQKLLSHPEFLEIDSETLNVILKLESISNLGEFDVFKQVMNWANKKCIGKSDLGNIDATGSMKRNVLGENIKLIRFAAMTSKEFVDCIEMEPGLLSDDECVSIFMNIISGNKNGYGILDTKRSVSEYDEIEKKTTREHLISEASGSSNKNFDIQSSNEFFVLNDDKGSQIKLIPNKLNSNRTDNNEKQLVSSIKSSLTISNSSIGKNANAIPLVASVGVTAKIPHDSSDKSEVSDSEHSCSNKCVKEAESNIATAELKSSNSNERSLTVKNVSQSTANFESKSLAKKDTKSLANVINTKMNVKENWRSFKSPGTLCLEMNRCPTIPMETNYFSMKFSVSKSIRLDGLEFFGKPRAIRVIISSIEGVKNVFMNHSKIVQQKIDFPEVNIEAGKLYNVSYTFLDSDGSEFICWRCNSKSVTFAVNDRKVDDIIFTFYGTVTSMHIAKIFFWYM